MKKLSIEAYSYLPNEEKEFAQLVLIPTISLFKGIDYYGVNFEWLFWYLSITKFQKIV